MITFSFDSARLQVRWAELVQDITNYYAYISFHTVERVPPLSKVTMNGDSKSYWICLSSHYCEDHYEQVLVSEKQFDVLSIWTKPFCGEATVKQLLNILGFSTFIREDSVKTWWQLPSQGFKQCISSFNKYAHFPNGGAPHFYLDISGEVIWIDLLQSGVTSSVEVKGDVVSDLSDSEWYLSVPANLKILHSSLDGIEEYDVIMDRSLPWAKTLCTDVSGRMRSLVEVAFKNEYNWRRHTSRRIMLSNVVSTPHRLGQAVKITEQVKGIITGVNIPLRLNSESINLSLVVSCRI